MRSVQVLPLILGMSRRQWCSDWAERWNPVSAHAEVASIALLMLLTVVLIAALPKVSLALMADLRGALLMLLSP